MKRALFLALKVIALTIILFICVAVAGTVVGLQDNTQPPADANAAVPTLVAVCFLQTIVLTYLILRSRWTGWRLMAAVFVAFYGVTTFVPQIESAVFLTRLPPGTVPRLFLMGALIAAPYSALAVLILGKRKAETVDVQPDSRLDMPVSEWTWKIAVIVVAYLILYFTFGYYIAWRNPAVLEYYGGTDPGGLLPQMASVLWKTPWLVPLQILRALCWAGLAVLVIRMMKGQWLESALVIALLFSVVMNVLLLLPNAYMPAPVRMAHLVETGSSNFIFGLLIGWLLPSHTSASVARVQLS